MRIRRRTEQQNEGNSKKGLRVTRRRVSPVKNHYLHAQRNMKLPTRLHEDPQKIMCLITSFVNMIKTS